MDAASEPGGDSEADATIVLVADDESAIRSSVRRILTAHGFRVLEAADGPTALEIAAAECRVHLLLTDVVMPGMDGPELARRVQERCPGTAVLFMTGYSTEAVERHGVLVPGTSLIQKPFTAAELLARVRDALGRR